MTSTIRHGLRIGAALCLLLSCKAAENGSPASPSGTGGSNAGATGGQSGTGGTPAGSGGTPASGGSTGASSGGASGTGGTAAGTGGAGAGGAAIDTTPGTPDTAAGDVALAGKLHRYLRTLKCMRPNPQDTRRSCFASDEDANKHDMFAFGGNPSVVYDVGLRIRGIVEPRGYTGGTLPYPDNPWFYVGGMPGGPDDNALYNQYKILVTEPKQVYYLNKNHDNILKSARDHDLHKIDYKVTVKVKGGTMIDVANEDRPSGMNANHMKLKVEGVPEDVLMQGADGFPGQFFYIEVESVTPSM